MQRGTRIVVPCALGEQLSIDWFDNGYGLRLGLG